MVDPANFDPTIAQAMASGADEATVLNFDFKADIKKYLDGRGDPAFHTLLDRINFNKAHAKEEMPFFAQEIFEASQAVDLEDPATIAAYNQAVANDKRRGGKDGIDAVLAQFKLDALIAPTNRIAWKIDLLDGTTS